MSSAIPNNAKESLEQLGSLLVFESEPEVVKILP